MFIFIFFNYSALGLFSLKKRKTIWNPLAIRHAQHRHSILNKHIIQTDLIMNNPIMFKIPQSMSESKH